MHRFNSEGVEIAYLDEPAAGRDLGEPIVLVHGFASSARTNWIGPRWVETLTSAGRRVIALDNRGHGQSDKPHDPQAYATPLMARDVENLIAHVGLTRVDLMGYSMGARIVAFLALKRPDLARSVILGGLGSHLVEGVGLPLGIAEAMEAPSLEDLVDPTQRMFRAFADQSRSDRRALAACIRGSRQTLSEADVRAIVAPALVAVGSRDAIAGDGLKLALMFSNGRFLDIPGRDHNPAVGDKVYKTGALAFLEERP
jgi:pimeloyl-ACP methyl ester carboxylesterase